MVAQSKELSTQNSEKKGEDEREALFLKLHCFFFWLPTTSFKSLANFG